MYTAARARASVVEVFKSKELLDKMLSDAAGPGKYQKEDPSKVLSELWHQELSRTQN